MTRLRYGLVSTAAALLAVNAHPSHAIGVFLHGFSGAGSSGSGTPGTEDMANDYAPIIPGDTYHGSWRAQADAVAKIKAAKEANPDEPVVLVGHSYGGDSVDEVAESLDECGICVDVYIQIDTVGAFDDTTPSNVKCGFNIHSTSGDGVNGESDVDGSTNIPIDGTSHTGIDDRDDGGTSSDPEYEGKNGHAVVGCILKHKLSGGRAEPSNPVIALQETEELVWTYHIDATCIGAALAHTFNTAYEDEWFANFDLLDEAGYDVDALESYVDAHENLIDGIDGSACKLNALRRSESDFLAFIDGLPAFAGGSPLLPNLGSPGDRGVGVSTMVAGPNPFTPLGTISVAFSLDARETVRLSVFDAQGRWVQDLHRGALAAGPHAFSWDGRDRGGREVAGGVYFAVLQTPVGTESVRLVLMK